VVTKTDKLKRQESQTARRTIGSKLGIEDMLILTSAKNGQGMNELWGAIRRLLDERSA
jgi:GTP-binding protein EngB required for normal cell division